MSEKYEVLLVTGEEQVEKSFPSSSLPSPSLPSSSQSIPSSPHLVGEAESLEKAGVSSESDYKERQSILKGEGRMSVLKDFGEELLKVQVKDTGLITVSYKKSTEPRQLILTRKEASWLSKELDKAHKESVCSQLTEVKSGGNYKV